MKAIILFNILFNLLLLADSHTFGYQVYKNKCASCHKESMSKEDVIKNLKNIKAPPMIEVSNRLKENIIIADDDEDVKRRVVIAFIKDYIDNPSIDYSMCHVMALEKFGVMPSQKGKLSLKEKEAVSEWLYDRFEGLEFK